VLLELYATSRRCPSPRQRRVSLPCAAESGQELHDTRNCYRMKLIAMDGARARRCPSGDLMSAERPSPLRGLDACRVVSRGATLLSRWAASAT
jgi:hypothetical protein